MSKSGKWIIYLVIAVIAAAIVWMLVARGGCPFRKCGQQCAAEPAAAAAPAVPASTEEAKTEPALPGNVEAEEIQADLQSVQVNP
ncbi:MAG: hypothetical protein AB7F40_02035 [Victivallaceae bacterium]|nr:hypothetical protein [Victivallaceae bacterium]